MSSLQSFTFCSCSLLTALAKPCRGRSEDLNSRQMSFEKNGNSCSSPFSCRSSVQMLQSLEEDGEGGSEFTPGWERGKSYIDR